MIATTADDFVNILRTELADQKTSAERGDGDCLWKDPEMYQYATEAVDRLVSDAKLTQLVVRLPYTAGVPLLRLPGYISEVRFVYDESDGREIRPQNVEDYQRGGIMPDLFGGTTAGIRYYVMDAEPGMIRIAPVPAADGAILVHVSASLKFPLAAGIPLPKLSADEIRCALFLAKSLAYQKHDAETLDLEKAEYYEQKYVRMVNDIEVGHRNKIRTPGHVRAYW